MSQKVVVTYSAAVQIGPEEWKQKLTSRVVSVDRPIKDLYGWLHMEGVSDPTINDIVISEYTGESL